ncbi:helix-turn-helix domain-containing protein [Asticcacaulis benevestitus]|uniref:HTH cro/C1-type domain-containing protein n=1 Tax=Asticcacaulis benevestitus DSM 16100 = ATCC BAA-896 TaxID=1121022 RepID=V4PUF2_9CAUL|nr:helix-turn-helix transcriptional regulator [Asticcacaulis benevestitus]ESQ89170.1 hypothetical protein ABENE_14445 [Asticcacaulis benevestitus DSM 16100 = ATCC BAA-896]
MEARSVGKFIRQRRRKLKISQEALASAIGLTFQQVQKYERGANRVSASMLYDISRILRCDAGDLLPRGDWKAHGVVSDWLQDARHRQHPDLFEALKAWPESHLRLLLATRQAPQKL